MKQYKITIFLVIACLFIYSAPTAFASQHYCSNTTPCTKAGTYCDKQAGAISGECKCAFGKMEILSGLPGFTDTNDICDFIDQATPIIKIAQNVINILIALVVGTGLIAIVVGGYVYMTAGGNSSQLGVAKKIIIAAILGIVLALTSWLILNTISRQFASEVRDPIEHARPIQ